MTPGISTHVFFDHRLHPGHLDALASAGAKTIEVFAARHHFDYTEPQSVREVAQWFRSNDVRAVLHQPIYISDRAGAFSHPDQAQWSRHVAPNLNLISERKSGRIASMDEVKRAIESAEQIPFAAVVLHLGLKETPWDEPGIEHSLTAIEHLKAFASPLGVRLLLENLQSDATTPEHLLYILKAGHFDSVGVCLDVGHLHLTANSVVASSSDIGPATPTAPVTMSFSDALAEAITLLGPRIAQLHLHDNHGPLSHSSEMKDEHLWPGEGTIDWEPVAAALATLPGATPAILEASTDRDTPVDAITRKAGEAFRILIDRDKEAQR